MITELPVTTLPGLRVPIHVSYLLYLAAVSPRMASAYFAAALAACRARHIEPSILLHPLDFLGADDVATLAFFPAMTLGGARKTALVEGFLRQLGARYDVVGMLTHVERIERRGGLATRQPRKVTVRA